ncbi:hypothetical protein [Caulobacter sp. SSI4214]|uniref:hypothetical protein n=1 Tax=Caulobacter sp. SSI4214 TaxID=2575739 RepID=UPI00143C5A9C|nr:hypothetical protein [Caulobacter sp. SSI4214]
MARQTTETYQHAISALLFRRGEMLEELAVIREQQARIANDLDALDRTLETLGYQGDVQLTARVPRVVLFYRGELRQYLIAQLRDHGPRTSRQMAEALAKEEGKEIADRRMLTDIVKRMGKALRLMADAGIVARTADKISGEYVWRLNSPA